MPQGNGQSSGSGIDTGTGGFPIDTPAGTQAYTIDTGTNANAEAPMWSPGNISVSDAPVDVSKTTKRTLASYLSRTTLGLSPSSPSPAANKYPVVNGPTEDPVELKLQEVGGYSPPLTVNSSQAAFKSSFQPSMSPSPAQITFNKGRLKPAQGATKDGNDLLITATQGSKPFPPPRGDINRADLSDPIKTYTVTTLSVNPFRQELQFLTTANALEEKIDVKKQLGLLKTTTASGVNPMNKGNFYPISVEVDASNAPNLTVTSLTDAQGYPASLRDMTNDNQLNFRDLGVGRSNDSTQLSILRGRQKPSSGVTTDGNSLLQFAADVLVGAAESPTPGTVNITKLSNSSPVKNYTEKLVQKNEYSDATKFSPTSTATKRSVTALESTPLSYPSRPEDLSDSRKKTLRDYMRKQTTEGGGKNKYQLDANPVVDESLRDVNGNPTSPHNSPNESKHIPDTLLKSRSADVPNLRIGKSTKNESGVDGNNLLKDVTTLPENGPIEPSVINGKLPPLGFKEPSSSSPAAAYSTSVVINRFNSRSDFETAGNPSGINAALYAKKYKMGESYGPNDPARELTYGRLAQIGNVLTQRAGIELNSNDPGNNPTSPTSQAASLLPGTAQLGVKKVNLSDLTARSVIDTLTQVGVSGDRMIDPANESWGSLNNVNDEYSGMSAFGMQLLAVALMVGVMIIVVAFFGLFQWAGSTAGDVGPRRQGNDGRRPFGAFSFDPFSKVDYNNPLSFLGAVGSKMNFWRLFGIDSTQNKLADCVIVGALSFFGVNSPDTKSDGAAAVALLKGALSVTSSPGYYSVVARNISRSYLIISDSFRTLGRAFSSGSGLAAGIKQLFGLIETFKNSKFFRIINVFSKLGDRVILNKDPESVDGESVGSGLRHVGAIEEAELKAYGKSRHNFTETLNNKPVNTLSLVWSSTRAPSLLMKNKYMSAGGVGDMSPPGLEPNFLVGLDKFKGGSAGTTKNSDTGRFDDTTREAMEEGLESEYVPFYFHDVRTNEIISFHAFLASLSDDYSVSYDNIDAFGRVEPLKIYKSTTRKLGVSFYVAAVNEYDFDTMWVKINKLVTMIYPQFDQGRQLERGNYKVTVPFSQTMKAPPFIRMRIGDLVTSNYSRFNLGRIFGFDNSQTKLVSGSSPVLASSVNSLEDQAQKVREVIEKNKETAGSEFKFTSNTTFSSLVFEDTSVNTEKLDISQLTFKVENKVINVDENNISGRLKFVGTDPQSTTKKLLDGKKCAISPKSLGEIVSPTIESIRSKISQNQNYSNYLSSMKDFLKDEGAESNAVSRSFRSSGGRGLGGFIESMSFDWYDKVTWEVQGSSGRKAPKMCKVTISFSPVHDIAPGLDHNGINRAPIYNIRQMGAGSRWRRG